MAELIPFNRASLTGCEVQNLVSAVNAGHISGDGSFTRACHALLEKIVEAKKALLTTSCTHALEMAALLLDIGADDEVIVPSFTFVSTVNAFVLRGARPVFIDIRPDTLNLDERLLESKITPRTRAIVPVHYAGVACEMDAILSIARRHGLAVIEDNAHGLFGRYHDRPLGSFGAMSTLSFHETKNVTCGEGGALMLNDEALMVRAEIIREKGTNRSQFFRGQVDKYGWVDVGSSYLPSEILAAFLHAQLTAADAIQAARRNLWNGYWRALGEWAARSGIGMPHVPSDREQPFHLFYLLLPSLERRQAFIAHMKERGIMTPFHYVPLHTSEMGRRLGGTPRECPVTESVSDRLVRLPLYPSLSAADQARVIDGAMEFRP